jgi:hypothetical protein
VRQAAADGSENLLLKRLAIPALPAGRASELQARPNSYAAGARICGKRGAVELTAQRIEFGQLVADASKLLLISEVSAATAMKFFPPS